MFRKWYDTVKADAGPAFTTSFAEANTAFHKAIAAHSVFVTGCVPIYLQGFAASYPGKPEEAEQELLTRAVQGYKFAAKVLSA